MTRIAGRIAAMVAAGCVIVTSAVILTSSSADAAKAKRVREAAPGGEAEETIDVGTRDVLERLKLLRVQMALDREEIEALKLRIEKIQLQREFENLLGGSGGGGGDDDGGSDRPRRRSASSGSNILVKAISLQPRKEAIILYRGRMFNVRPGDSVGGIKIKDITESGLKIGRSGRGGGSVLR